MPAGGSSNVRAGRAYVEIGADDKSLMAGLNKSAARVKAFAKSVEQVGAKMKSAGQSLATYGVAAALPLGFAVKTFAEFDDKMREVQAVTQASGSDFDRLTAKAKELGASTSFTAVQVGSLMAELGRAGFKPDEIEAMTGAVLDLSRATSTDATLASGIMAASIRQFSLGAGDAAKVSDALTVAANKSFNTVEQLGEALSYAGPTAADANMSLEDTLAILGALGNVGIQGSNAGTAVRRLLTLTGAESEKMKDIFGVNAVDAAGNVRPLVDVLDEVNTATKDLGNAQRSAKFNEFFGLLGITGASALSKNAVGVRELQGQLKGAGGAAHAAAAAMDAGLGGSFRIAASAVEGVAIAIGGALAPRLQWLTDKFAVVASTVGGFIAKNGELVTAIAAVAVGAVAAGAALVVVGTVVSAIGTVLGAVAGVVALLLSPVTYFTAAIVGVVGVAAGLAVVGAVLGAMAVHAAIVGGIFDQLFGPAMRGAVGLFNDGLSQSGSLLGWLSAMADHYAAVVTAAFPFVQTQIDAIGRAWGGVKDDFDKAWKGIKDALAAGDLALAGAIAMASLRLAWSRGVNLMLETWNVLREGTADSFARIFKGVLTLWESAKHALFTSVIDLAQGIVKAFAAAFEAVVGKVASLELTARLAVIQVRASAGLIDANQVNAEITKAMKTADERNSLAKTVGDVGPAVAGMFASLLSGIEEKRHAARLKQIDDEARALKAKVTGAIPGADTSAIQAEIDRLKTERDKLVQKAAAEAAGGPAAAAGPSAPSTPAAPTVPGSPAKAVEAVVAGMETRGTFSGIAAGLLGGVGGRTAERTAKATEKTAALLEKNNDLLRRGRTITFG